MSQLQTPTRPAEHTTAPAALRTNRMAIWALVLAILTLGGVGSVVGIVMGAQACKRVQATGERGARLAAAAIVVGVLTMLFAIAYWIVIARHFSAGGGGGGTGTGGGGGGC